MVDDLALSGATVTVMGEDGRQGLVAASGPDARPFDAVQFDTGEGPSRDAFETRRPVVVPDVNASDGRWPGLTSLADSAGVRAIYAFPLQLGASRLGVLTGYSATTRSLTQLDLLSCATYAEVATQLLIDTAPGQPYHGGPETFMEHDVEVRTEVYQAQGMVKVALGVDLAEALARLRALAFAEGLDLNTLAAQVVAGRELPQDPPTPPPPGPDAEIADA